MDPQFGFAIAAVFAAATLQSATGIGFGVIAGPILLALMNDALAVQVSIILNLLIALVLAPTVWRHVDRQLIPALVTGLLLGSPLGLFIFSIVSLTYLKLLAAAFVLLALTVLLMGEKLKFTSSCKMPGKLERVSIGAVAGMMGSSLGMPGPIPAAWMSARGIDKTTVRATILVLFVAAYGSALLLQIVTLGVAGSTASQCLVLSVPTVAGIVLGKQLANRVSERSFRMILTVTLTMTVLILIASI